ncbi:MAG: hypothetical protein ACKO6B_10965, partial [Planctomycetia bacterium]
MSFHPLPPTGPPRCRPRPGGSLRFGVALTLAVVSAAVLAGASALATESELVWTAEPSNHLAQRVSGGPSMPTPVQEQLPPLEPGGQMPFSPLPPTQPRGPVVLDMPYEEAPDCPDDCLPPGVGFPEGFDDLWAPRPWFWQIMPNNLIYTSYLAGPKEPRLGTSVYRDTAR